MPGQKCNKKMLNRCFVLQNFRIAQNIGITFSMLKQENGNHRKEMKSVFFDVGVRETAVCNK